MTTTDIALTTFNYLGGRNKLKVMIGAKDFAYDSKNGDISFKFPRAKKGINYIKIHLNGKDLYDITFGKIVKFDYTVINKIDDVYFDELKSSIEKTIGLYLSL